MGLRRKRRAEASDRLGPKETRLLVELSEDRRRIEQGLQNDPHRCRSISR
jgi:hypothetical protein